MKAYKDEIIYDDVFYYVLLQRVNYLLNQVVLSDVNYTDELNKFNNYIHNTIQEAPRKFKKQELIKYFNSKLPFSMNTNTSLDYHNEYSSKGILDSITDFINNPEKIVKYTDFGRESKLRKGPTNNSEHLKYLELTQHFTKKATDSNLIFEELPIEKPKCRLKKETLDKLNELKNKFKFKYIAIESCCSDEVVDNWIADLNTSLTKIFDRIEVPYEMASLNGKLALVLNPMFCSSLQHNSVAGYVDINWEHPTLCLASKGKFTESLLIHEYTHLVDYFSAYSKNNQYGYCLSDNVLKKLSRKNDNKNNVVENNMTEILTYLISGISKEEYLLQQTKEKDKLFESIINQLEQLIIDIIPEFRLMNSTNLESFIENFLVDCFFENNMSESESNHKSYGNLLNDLLFKGLTEEQNIKLKENTVKIINRLKNIVNQESYNSNYSVSSDLYFFAKNDFARIPLNIAYEEQEKNKNYYKKFYATDPKELLARVTELALMEEKISAKDREFNNLYKIELSENQKQFLQNNFFNLFQMTNKKFNFCKEFGDGKYKEIKMPFCEPLISKKPKM